MEVLFSVCILQDLICFRHLKSESPHCRIPGACSPVELCPLWHPRSWRVRGAFRRNGASWKSPRVGSLMWAMFKILCLMIGLSNLWGIVSATARYDGMSADMWGVLSERGCTWLHQSPGRKHQPVSHERKAPFHTVSILLLSLYFGNSTPVTKIEILTFTGW